MKLIFPILFLVFSFLVPDISIANAASLATLDTRQDASLASLNQVNAKSIEGHFIVHIVYNIINIFLSILGMIFLTLMLVSGFKWMTAAGNEEKTREAIDTVRRAIVGIIIIVIAYAITRLLFGFKVN